MKKPDRHGEVSIEITSVECGVYVGSLVIDGLVAGYVCFDRPRDKPKRTANVIRRLRLSGIPVNFPQYAKEADHGAEEEDG